MHSDRDQPRSTSTMQIMMGLFHKLSLRERIVLITQGLRQPPGSPAVIGDEADPPDGGDLAAVHPSARTADESRRTDGGRRDCDQARAAPSRENETEAH